MVFAVKLQYFRGNKPNFGDELNPWLWPQLLPGFFDGDPKTLFVGIGSILGEVYEPTAKKVVFGAGYASSYHNQVPNVHGADWDIFFVRGPRTARALRLPENIGIGDPAILVRELSAPLRREARFVGFMPHWQSLDRGKWETVCNLAGIRLINPCAPVEQVIAEILRCKVLVSEAMHGAIVADALRVPWIPALPIDDSHREKWFDWADTLGIELRQRRLWPSSPSELQLVLHRPRLAKRIAALNQKAISQLASTLMEYAAARRLSRLAKSDPYLSADSATKILLEQMLEKLQQLQIRYKR
jgi:succinoglycan biosynthesis protein ExoV